MGTCLTTHGLGEEIACDFDDDAFWKSPPLPCIKSAEELKVPVEVLNELPTEFCWSQNLSPEFVAELCRRGMWAVFRLEAEHLHNTEGFRRVEVIPLHFDRKPARDDEGDEKRTLGQQLGVAAELASYAGVVALLALLAWITSPLGAAAGGHPDDDHGSKLG